MKLILLLCRGGGQRWLVSVLLIRLGDIRETSQAVCRILSPHRPKHVPRQGI